MSYIHCILYVAGLLVVYAYDDISFNKIATQSHTYVGVGYDASNAVDGNIATCTRANVIGPNALDKTVWWKVDLDGIFNIYRINILFKNYDGFDIRQRGRIAGFSLLVSKTGDIQGATLCYKNGPQLPPLNFTSICTDLGRYVIFYNERLDGVTYPDGYEVINVHTELCEVTVQGCKNASFYGINCDTPCPTNCQKNTCHIQSGSCFNCKTGWTGMYCNTKCKDGLYGYNCTHQCVGYCKDSITCNHVTGLCDGGCDAGWTGSLCDKECEDGTYGYNCAHSCSGHCLNNSPCNKQTGHCDRGCNPGYTDNKCSKECSSDYYGMNCNERCSGHCINNKPCHHVSGECSNGCKDGYIGLLCNDACKEGYFGTKCSRVCSPNCKPDTCRHTDGSCTSCTAGWTGYNCTTECMLTYGENCQHSCSVLCFNKTCDRINGSCLYGCKCGKQCDEDKAKHLLTSHDMLSSTGFVIGLSISISLNIFLIVCGIELCRRINRMKITDSPMSCGNESVYLHTVVKSEEASTYQELDLSKNAYQNTTIR